MRIGVLAGCLSGGVAGVVAAGDADATFVPIELDFLNVIFKNPFAKALRQWEMREPSKLIYDAHTLWLKHREKIEKEMSDEEFMALFEQFPDFEDLDDKFIENEEVWTEDIAHYIDDHLEKFAKIVE